MLKTLLILFLLIENIFAGPTTTTTATAYNHVCASGCVASLVACYAAAGFVFGKLKMNITNMF